MWGSGRSPKEVERGGGQPLAVPASPGRTALKWVSLPRLWVLAEREAWQLMPPTHPPRCPSAWYLSAAGYCSLDRFCVTLGKEEVKTLSKVPSGVVTLLKQGS